MDSRVVSVRIPIADLEKLRILAQVLGQPVGGLIRDAVAKHIQDLATTDEFRTRAVKMKTLFDETLSQMLRPTT